MLRSQDHLDHLEMLTQDGFVATDWVQLVATGLPKKDACVREQSLIRELNPLYNKPQGKHLLKVTPELYKQCVDMRNQGMFYSQISDAVGVSPMTVYRALNNQTKNIGEDYAS